MPQAFITYPSEARIDNPDDRRGDTRFPCELTTLCQPIGDGASHSLWFAGLRDISEGGLRLSLPCWLQAGSLLAIEVPRAEHESPRLLRVKVVHATAEGDGWSLGCAFLGTMTAEEQIDVSALIAETARTMPKLPTTADAAACLVAIYPSGPGMGKRYLVEQRPLTVGRGEQNDVRINDHTVSRCHARIESEANTYRVIDNGSTNGTFVNDRQITVHQLTDGDYLRLGGCIFRFLAGGNVEAHYHEEIYRLSMYDGLTSIHNQHFLIEYLQRELAHCVRQRDALALVLFDIDFFKSINDRLGHLGGDFTLQRLAHRVRASIRKDELFARYGGDEFAVVLPGGTLDQARELAERLHEVVKSEPFRYEDQEYAVSISIGIAHTRGDRALTPQDLVRQADENLYGAKGQGRDCVVAPVETKAFRQAGTTPNFRNIS